MLLDDQRKFDDQMKEYSQHLKKILVEKENSKGQRKQTFLTDDYNVLSYKETSNNKVVEKSDNNNLVEVKKLMRFAKNKNNEKEIVSQEAKSSLIHDHLTNSKIEKGDTTKIVKREIVNSILIEELLRQKRQNLENYLKDEEMPKLEDYEKVLKKNVTTQKISQHTSAMPNIRDGEVNQENKSFKNSLKDNYKAKQIQWEVDNYQNDNTEKLDKERRKETKMFLKQIKKRPRFAQEYVDGYSLRDSTVNQNILQFNKMLGKQFYDKKRLNRKIDDFINEVFNKNSDIEEGSVFNSIKYSKNDDLKKKIRENLKNEEEEKIEIEYGKKENEMVMALVNSAQKTGVQFFKEQKNDYEDFLKFREKVINLEKEKEHEENNKFKSEKIKKNKTIKEIRRNSHNFDANKSNEIISGNGN